MPKLDILSNILNFVYRMVPNVITLGILTFCGCSFVDSPSISGYSQTEKSITVKFASKFKSAKILILSNVPESLNIIELKKNQRVCTSEMEN